MGDRFPPLSISLKTFLRDGTDKPFRHLIFGMFGVMSLVLQARERLAARAGVSAPQLSMIFAIADAEMATISEIAHILRVSSPHVTAEANKLVARRILTRRPHERDGRSIYLSLSPKGREILRKIAPSRQTANDITFGQLTHQQAKLLLDTIDVLLDGAERAVHMLDTPGENTDSARKSG